MELAVRVELAGLSEDNRREGLCRRPSPHPLRPLLKAQFERATWRSQIRGRSGSPTSFPRGAQVTALNNEVEALCVAAEAQVVEPEGDEPSGPVH
ncbi:hypothetical protein ZWY2020_025600 [Hordeum vulgare]|nr:hypothetical protein ZWY2020_025600 [Hordeum vulgare]